MQRSARIAKISAAATKTNRNTSKQSIFVWDTKKHGFGNPIKNTVAVSTSLCGVANDAILGGKTMGLGFLAVGQDSV